MLIKKTDNPQPRLRIGTAVLVLGLAAMIIGITLPPSFAGAQSDFIRGIAYGVSIAWEIAGLFLLMRARQQLK